MIPALEMIYSDIDFSPPRPKPPSFKDCKPEPAEKPLPFENTSGMCPRELSAFLASYNRPATKSAASVVSDFDADIIADPAPAPASAQFSKRAPSPSKVTYRKTESGATFAFDVNGQILGCYPAGTVVPDLEATR